MDGNTLKRRLSDCGMNFNVNTKTAACDLSRHQEGCESLRGAIYSNLWASLTWKWASKERRITGKSCEGVYTSLSAHHRFNTSKIIDHPLPKYGWLTKLCPVWTSVLNSGLSILLFPSHWVAMWTAALFWIRLLASTTLACCGF